MFASIKPILFQWPFLSVMYLLFRSPLIAGKPNTLLGHDLLGVPLGSHWLSGAGPVSLQGGVFLGLFALLAGLCWLSGRLGRLMAAPAAPAASAAGLSDGIRTAPKDPKDPKDPTLRPYSCLPWVGTTHRSGTVRS